MKKIFPLPLFLFFSISIFILWILGTWQLNKNYFYDKNNIIFNNSSKSIATKVSNLKSNLDNLTFVEIEGEELIGKTIYLEPRTFKGQVGYHEISAFKVNEDYLLINKGFINAKPEKKKNSIKRKVEGYIIKVPEPKFFELKNYIKNNTLYTLNLEDFKNEFKLKLSSYILYEQNIKDQKVRKPVLPNLVSNINHLNYALTWYFLSLSLCVIFFIYFKKTFINYE